MNQTCLPGLMRVDHIALTVPDLEKAVRFYCDVFGARELYRMGPFDARELPRMPDGRDWTDAHLNIPGARLHFAMLAIGETLMLELFRYELPDNAALTAPRNCDIGASHIAFRVADLDKAIAYLHERGIAVMEGPIVIESGPCAGLRVNYVLDPFGNQLELVEYDKLPYQAASPN